MSKATPDFAAKAQAFLDRYPLIDAHNDLPYVVHAATRGDLERFGVHRELQNHDTDIPRLKRGKVAAQFWASFIPTNVADPARTRLEVMAVPLEMERRYAEVFLPGRRSADVARARRLGRIASFITIEGCVGLEGSLSQIGVWHAAGARLVTLCHNESLEWVDSATDAPRSGGLSPFGHTVIGELNRLGMVIDCSHASPAAAHQAVAASRAPIVLSHSNAATLCDHPRNAPDDLIDAVAAKGGLVMLTFVPVFVSQKLWDWARPLNTDKGIRRPDYGSRRTARSKEVGPAPAATLAEYCDHIDYMAKRAGWRHVGIGSDFYGGDAVQGLESVACFPAIFAELMRRGWSERKLAALAGGNMLRVMRAVEKAAG
jgi:membrane dipeptidase